MKGESEEGRWKSARLYVTVHNCSSNPIILKSFESTNVQSQSNTDSIFPVNQKQWRYISVVSVSRIYLHRI